MYDYIEGKVSEATPTYAVIEAYGVGYYLLISLKTYSDLEKQQTARVYTHFAVREDAQILYGFSTKEEREIFRLLISVSGVGGNTARMILSSYEPGELIRIISTDNVGMLKSVKGLGVKTAQKIILELKDKTNSFAAAAQAEGLVSVQAADREVYAEAVAALGMLGFNKAASEKVVQNILKENTNISVEDAIKLSLKRL